MNRLTVAPGACCFSGHRQIPEGQYEAIAAETALWVRWLYQQGVTRFYAGGALGFDFIAAVTVINLRRELPELRLTLAIPHRHYDRVWTEWDQERYRPVLRAADEVLYLYDDYRSWVMHSRNRYMVEHSTVCLCYMTEDGSGTGYTVSYARKKGLTIINVADAFRTEPRP